MTTTIALYNTPARRIEPISLHKNPVTIYVCGITPYDTTHLGHAFTYAVADHLIRFIEFLGKSVRYVQNVTDIDDDILRKAAEVGENWRTLGNRWTAHFIQDMQRLNIRPPDHYPRASDYIPQIIHSIEILLERSLAYVADNGSVYYQAQKWPKFGKLSGLDSTELLDVANEHGNIPDDPYKNDPLDFPLWQTQQEGEPSWDSPWGPGRPGWHIECSSMVIELLGQTVDFHGGGNDLAFPHHECEIAQAEPVTGKSPFVRSWFHAAMVEHQGEKMSKSLGNLIMARDILEEFTPDALRLYLASHHYRKPWAYSKEAIQTAAKQAARWSATVTKPGGTKGIFKLPPALRDEFTAALGNDLDTPAAIQTLDAMADTLHAAATAEENVADARQDFMQMAGVLGLRLVSPMPESNVIKGWRRHLAQFEPAPIAQDRPQVNAG